jgi:hypothetical protein
MERKWCAAVWYLTSGMRHRLASAFFFAALVMGCGGPDPRSPDRPRPPYEGRSVEVFDDTIEPRAVGLNLDDARTARGDGALAERLALAEGTARVAITTVTGRGDGVEVEYVIQVKVVEKLNGDLPEELSIYVGKQSPSLGIVKSMDSRLGGKTLIAFLKEFKGPDGEPRWHFHVSPDTKDVIAAINDALALQSVSPCSAGHSGPDCKQ